MSFDLKLYNGKLSLKDGKLETVSDSDKLLQDILKMLFTKVGANPLSAWYGSYLTQSVIGQANIDPQLTQAVAQTQISQSLSMLKKLQDQQFNTFQNVVPAEQIAGIQNVSVALDANDPRRYIVSIVVISKDRKEVKTTFGISPAAGN